MGKTRGAYAPEFRGQMVELVHAGCSPEELAGEFEPTAQSIRNWVALSERNAGRGDGGLTTAEREELNWLRRENRQLRLERDFQVHGITASGEVTVHHKLRRGKVLAFFQSLTPCLVGMEACATARHWAHELTELGHTVKPMPPVEACP